MDKCTEINNFYLAYVKFNLAAEKEEYFRYDFC